jgi:HK97 family phage portal protein
VGIFSSIRWADAPVSTDAPVEVLEEETPTEELALQQQTGIALVIKDAIDNLSGESNSIISAVSRATDFLSSTVSASELKAVNEVTGAVLPTPQILRRPNPNIPLTTFLQQTVWSMLDDGNAFLIPLTYDKTQNPTMVIVADPTEVEVAWDRKRIFLEYAWRGQPVTDIIHISQPRKPWEERATGPMKRADKLLQTMKAELGYVLNLYLNNAQPGVGIEIPDKLGRERLKEVQDDFNEAHKQKSGGVAVVDGGARIRNMTMTSAEAQINESRSWHVQDVGRAFSIFAYFLGESMGTSLTYATQESIARAQMTTAIYPLYLNPIAEGFTELLPKGQKAVLDPGKLLVADRKERYDSHKASRFWKTTNEIRQEEGYAPMTGGNTLASEPNQEPQDDNPTDN